MWEAFTPIQKHLSKLLSYQEIKTDNVLFRLHCIITVAVLVGSSVVLTTNQLIGNPIACLTTQGERLKEWTKPIQTFCWVNNTFLMPVEFNKEIGENMAYPGVMNEYDANGKPKRFYAYYQWACFVLFLQGMMCYIPRALWNIAEGGLLTKLTTGLQGACLRGEQEKRTDSIVSYLLRYKKEHTKYAFVYWLCEALCLVNLILQMWMMNVFLGGYFWEYGVKALKYSQTSQYERDDPLIYIFPRVTKCTFNYYGPSGSIVNLDNLCVLPQNVINEKIYIILWFWYIILAAMFVLVLIYRVLLVVYPKIRPRLLVARTRYIPIEDARKVSSMTDLGDWWLLYMLSKSIDALVYRNLIIEYIKRGKKAELC